MKIACLGWGSLIWRPENLPCGEWRQDGPSLPLEFSRVSQDGRMTLVIDPTAKEVTVLWAELDVGSLEKATEALATREGITSLHSIGRWPAPVSSLFSEQIGSWATEKDVDGVVWTALKPGFAGDRGRSPSLAELKAHIDGLSVSQFASAAEYVDRSPAQITTTMRQELQRLLSISANGKIDESESSS